MNHTQNNDPYQMMEKYGKLNQMGTSKGLIKIVQSYKHVCNMREVMVLPIRMGIGFPYYSPPLTGDAVTPITLSKKELYKNKKKQQVSRKYSSGRIFVSRGTHNKKASISSHNALEIMNAS